MIDRVCGKSSVSVSFYTEVLAKSVKAGKGNLYLENMLILALNESLFFFFFLGWEGSYAKECHQVVGVKTISTWYQSFLLGLLFCPCIAFVSATMANPFIISLHQHHGGQKPTQQLCCCWCSTELPHGLPAPPGSLRYVISKHLLGQSFNQIRGSLQRIMQV